MSITRRRRHEERGVETVAMLFVIPVLVILVLTLIDVGMMFRTRMLAENVVRDAVRGAAADGGLRNARTTMMEDSWDQWAMKQIYWGGECKLGQCDPASPPTINCYYVNSSGGIYGGAEVIMAGDLVTCEVHYPYRGINEELLGGPLGMGFGSLLKDFHVKVAARAETGNTSGFGG